MIKQELTYYPNYTIKSYKEYFDGILICYTKYDTNQMKIYTKTPIVEYRSKNGLIHGMCNSYYENGNLKNKTKYKNGLKQGWSYRYYISGELSEKMYYKKDKLHGKFISYYPNGIVFTEHNYISNLINGKSFTYDFDGNIYIERNYVNNVQVDIKYYD